MTPDRINMDERMTDLETLARSVAATIKAHCDRRKGSADDLFARRAAQL